MSEPLFQNHWKRDTQTSQTSDCYVVIKVRLSFTFDVVSFPCISSIGHSSRMNSTVVTSTTILRCNLHNVPPFHRHSHFTDHSVSLEHSQPCSLHQPQTSLRQVSHSAAPDCQQQDLLAIELANNSPDDVLTMACQIVKK
jgi:hypothetical protein